VGVVNAATAIAARNRGVGVAAGVAVASALLTSLAVWLLGCLAIRRRRLVVVERRPSMRRVAALILAVFLASLATGIIVQLVSVFIEWMEVRPPESGG
jgi:hypothetical protein